MDSEARARLQEAAERVKKTAAANASAMRVHGGQELSIEYDDYGARIVTYNGAARAFELGIRHPLNYPNQAGNSWGNTPHRPFLSRAAEEDADIVTETLAKVVEDYARGADYEVG